MARLLSQASAASQAASAASEGVGHAFVKFFHVLQQVVDKKTLGDFIEDRAIRTLETVMAIQHGFHDGRGLLQDDDLGHL